MAGIIMIKYKYGRVYLDNKEIRLGSINGKVHISDGNGIPHYTVQNMILEVILKNLWMKKVGTKYIFVYNNRGYITNGKKIKELRWDQLSDYIIGDKYEELPEL